MATNPTLLTMPIAENGQKNTIPATQAAAGDGLLSQSTGFPPETALPLGAGGKAPTREDFNGAFNLLSDIAFYAQKGWTFEYDATQDYYKGCVVIDPSDGNRYECVADMPAGTVAPHSDTANTYWKEFHLGGGLPIGTIFAYGGSTNPEGALLCNGAAVSRTMYADLFDEIGTKYGSGDGSTTFNLPNLIDAAIMNGTYDKTAYESAGSYTFTAPKSGFYKVTVKGAGGGGASASGSGSLGVGGGGGGEGGLTIGYEHMDAGDTATVVIGAGGAGGDGADGADGGNSTVTANLSTYTGGGGVKGTRGNAGGGAGGTGTILGAPGSAGDVVYSSATTGVSGGSGGGNGGAYGRASSSGKNGTNGGGGSGGGGNTSNGTQHKGGDGGDGYAWIEYIGASENWYIQAFTDSTDPALVDLTQIVQDLANRLTREQTPAFNKRDVLTVSGTYTAPVTGWYRITVKGGGGGGCGAYHNGTSYLSSVYGGGEGGTTIGYEHLSAGDTATVVIGAGGIGGAANGGAGTDGGNSSVTVNNNAYTGGGGGKGKTAVTGGNGTGGTGTISGLPGGVVSGYVGGYGAIGFPAANGGGSNGGKSGYISSDGTSYAGENGGSGFATFEYFAAS